MYASIDENGKLTVEGETPLECYALTKWTEDNFKYTELSIGNYYTGDNFLVKFGRNVILED